MLNCKETMVKKKRIVIRIAFCDFALWNSDHRNLGLVFPEFLFFWAEWNASVSYKHLINVFLPWLILQEEVS